MSIKRQATTELNHDNWDQDDPSEHEEMGSFKPAPKDVLEKRVIRTAKRRSQVQASGDEPKKSVFSGFGGFNKTQPSSFDFLANLTNGNKTTNGTSASKSETSSGLFSSKPMASSPGSGLFSAPVTTASSKPTFGIPSTQSTLFGGSTASPVQTPFSASLSNKKETPFKIQTSSNDGVTDMSKSNNTNSIFGSFTNTSQSPFSGTNISAPPLKMNSSNPNINDKKEEDKSEEKKLKYYAKLKGLNESVSDWIKKHVEETPLCILSPIFKDYEKYLKEIQEEYEGPASEISLKSSKSSDAGKSNAIASPAKTSQEPPPITGSSLFSSTKPTMFGKETNYVTPDKAPAVTFGIPSTTTTLTGGFSFGINNTTTTTSSPFTLSTNSTTGSNGPSAPFSFGTGKPFSFGDIPKAPDVSNEEKKDKEDEEEPPKVEFTPVVEENSVYDKRCKIFVKKDGNFADKGVGTLYIKKIEESGKHQLLVRANTSLGNILLNLILVTSLPTQRLGKNNVMLVCIPTPEAKPPPTPVLIRVKTSEEADELLETLNKYKA